MTRSLNAAHVAGIVHPNGSQFCARCGVLICAVEDPSWRPPVGSLLHTEAPCRFPIKGGDGRKVDSPSGE